MCGGYAACWSYFDGRQFVAWKEWSASHFFFETTEMSKGIASNGQRLSAALNDEERKAYENGDFENHPVNEK